MMPQLSQSRSWGYASMLVLVFFGYACESFSVPNQSASFGTSSIPSTKSPLDSVIGGKSQTRGKAITTTTTCYPTRYRPPRMTTADEASPDESSDEIEITTPIDPAGALKKAKIDSLKNDKKTTKGKLLTVPLFLKFVAVLLIKFLTDLIVFPVLFLYRLAHNAKRRILRFFRRGPAKPNGEKS